MSHPPLGIANHCVERIREGPAQVGPEANLENPDIAVGAVICNDPIDGLL
jgi:hypothetical protein